MDSSLSSERHNGGGRYGRRGRGPHRHHPYRRDDYGGVRHRGGRRGRRGRSGPRAPANRFSAETKSVDPQCAIRKQLTAMVAKMGDVGGAAEVAVANGGNSEGAVRPVIQAVVRNISDLVDVLCSHTNAALFLRFGEMQEESPENGGDADKERIETRKADGEAGMLATIVHACATNLPMQTPSYAALTLGVECRAPQETHSGFADRCLQLGMRCFGADLDMALDCKPADGHTIDGTNEDKKRRGATRCTAEQSGGFGNMIHVDAYYRCKLFLRYLAHLAQIGIVSIGQLQTGHPYKSQNFDTNDGNRYSLMGLLQLLVQCACNAASTASSNNQSWSVEQRRALGRASTILASLVLSTLPYVIHRGEPNDDSADSNAIIECMDELEANVLGPLSLYSSDYEPGVGSLAILLKEEIDDSADMEENDEDEEDDDEEEKEDELPPPCADTLQDLLRTVRKIVSSSQNQKQLCRFALLDDAPWSALEMKVASDSMETEDSTGEAIIPMTYEKDALLLDLIGGEECRCKCVPYLLSIREEFSNESNIELNCSMLDGIVFGRLNIFDASIDIDEEEENEGTKEMNPNLDSYVKTYSLVDRFFLSDTIRDVLMCHRPMVSDAGAARSDVKEVAEQIWVISHLIHPHRPDGIDGGDMITSCDSEINSRGIEYGIVETLLSLIAQGTPGACGVPASSPVQQHLYLSRVLLELTKLKPSLIPRAIVNAVSGVFQDFIPSLTPVARENLASWLAFHLTNTEYQWPKAFWDHWQPYAASKCRNSRGNFVIMTLHFMAAMSSEGAAMIVKECLTNQSALAQSVFLKPIEESSSLCEDDLVDRFWNMNQDPDVIRQFVTSDEFSQSYDAISDGNEDHSMFHRSVWGRTRIVTRALFHPICREKIRELRSTEKAWKEEDNGTITDDAADGPEDITSDLIDAIPRFKSVILAALARDADTYDSISTEKVDDDQLLLAGEVSILLELETIVPPWDTILSSAIILRFIANKVVSALAVATWALSDHDSSSTHISPSWWKFVSLAINCSIALALSSLDGVSTELSGGIQMIIDDVGINNEDSNETTAKRLDEALKVTVPILHYVVKRGCQVLADNSSGKQGAFLRANVYEGIKCLLRATRFHFYNHLSLPKPSESRILSSAQVLQGFASVGMNGEKLSSICHKFLASCEGDQGKMHLQWLASLLEKLL